MYKNQKAYKSMNRLQEKAKHYIKDIKIQNIYANNNYIVAAKRARNWIERNTIQNKGIVITSKQRTIYQEVTGYYIPTLLQWGMRDRAIAYAEYLCDIQEDSGAWLNGEQRNPSVFNTGQVLRGLLAIVDIYPRAYDCLIKGCDWLISNMNETGRLVATEGTKWSKNFNSELIHLYCLPPLWETGEKYQRSDYKEAVNRIKEYYVTNYIKDIENFNYLSHFYAYVLEALFDLGEIEIVKKAMRQIERIQRIDGSVPAFRNCNWVCSTGLFQLAIVWFKLGKWKPGAKAFDYAVSLQNKTGGWFGGYNAYLKLPNGKKIPYSAKENVRYFPDQEISWAVKYFFDALFYRELLEFEKKAHTFIDYIDEKDSRYQAVFTELKKQTEKGESLKVLDVGCGKGRYLKKMIYSYPSNQYYGIDISDEVLKYIKNPQINIARGSILYTEKEDDEYDLVIATESLEHSIFIDLAINELARITKMDGTIVIIDKDEQYFEEVKYRDWIIPEELSTKQWIKTEDIESSFIKNGFVEFQIKDIPTSEGKLYKAYIGRRSDKEWKK